jgi:hypothetical protein
LTFSGVAVEAAGGFDQTMYAAEDVLLSRRLRSLGRFVTLREVVVTSGRNLRSHSAFQVLCVVVGFALPDQFSLIESFPWRCLFSLPPDWGQPFRAGNWGGTLPARIKEAGVALGS